MAAFPSYVFGDLFVCLSQGSMTIPFALNIFMASGCFSVLLFYGPELLPVLDS